MKLWFILIFSWNLTALGAACCGSGPMVSPIINSSSQFQISALYSDTIVAVDNVDSHGYWRKWDEHQKIKTFRLDSAVTIDDVWQIGASIPIIQRTQHDQQFSGLSDINLTFGYEYWTRTVGFLQIIIPTGKSKLDSDVGGLDSRGNGFWALGLGTAVTQVISEWDFLTSLDIHHGFRKTIRDIELNPGWGGNFAVGAGYNLKDIRFGSHLMWTYEDPLTADSGLERYATASFSGSYIINSEWTGNLTYSDQTLFGSPLNTSLGQTLALQIQRHWSQ